MGNIIPLLSRIKQNKTIRNGALFSIYSFFNRGISFILLILLANYIMPTEYGRLSLYNTVVMFVGYFVDLNSRGYLGISYFKNDNNDFRKDFSAICIITAIVTIFMVVITLIFQNPLSKVLNLDESLLYLSLLSSFCCVFITMNLDYLRVQERVTIYGILSCSFAVLNMIFSLYLVINKDLNWYGRVYAQIVCDLIFFVIAIIWFIKERLICFSLEWKRYKRIIWWSIPLIPHSMSVWLRQGVDRYIIESTHTTADVGIFSFALNLTSIIIMIGMAFNAANSVNIYQVLSSNMDETDKKSNLKRKERFISMLYLISTIIIVIGVVIIVPIVLPHYVDAIPYFIILSVYGFMQCMYFLYCNYLFYFNKTKELMYITFGCSIMHLVLSIILTKYNLYFTAIIYIISFTVMTLFVKRKARSVFSLNIR